MPLDKVELVKAEQIIKELVWLSRDHRSCDPISHAKTKKDILAVYDRAQLIDWDSAPDDLFTEYDELVNKCNDILAI